MKLKPIALYMKVAALAHVTIRDYYTNNSLHLEGDSGVGSTSVKLNELPF